MAKQAKDPTKGSQREASVEGNTAGGLSFADLIKSATGTDAPTKKEFQSAMTARGYRHGDVRKLVKAFDQVTESGKDYFLRDEGFDVYDQGAREGGSGRAKGNAMGADFGDIVGLGNNVSLLAGALRNEKAGYEHKRAKEDAVSKGAAAPTDAGQKIQKDTMSGTKSPLENFAVTMRDLINGTGGGQAGKTAGKGKKGGTGQQGQAAGQQSPGFVPDMDLLNWSPKDVLRNSPLGFFQDGQGNGQQSPGAQQEDGQTGALGDGSLLGPDGNIMDPYQFMTDEPGLQGRERKMAEADKNRELTWENLTNGNAFTSLADPYAWASATENVKGAAGAGGQSFAMASPFISNPALAKVYNRYMLPFQLMGAGADAVADSFTDEGIQGDEMIADAAQIGANTIGTNAAPWLRGKFGKAKGLEQTMKQNAKAIPRTSRFSAPPRSAAKPRVKFGPSTHMTGTDAEAMRKLFLEQSYKNAPFPYQSVLPFEDGGKLFNY